jgi:hypothetical protein
MQIVNTKIEKLPGEERGRPGNVRALGMLYPCKGGGEKPSR